MAPLLNTLISRIVFGETKKKRGDLPRPASLAFSEGDFPGGLHHALSSAAISPAPGSSQQPSAVNSPLHASLQGPSAPAGQFQPSPLHSTRSDDSRLRQALSHHDLADSQQQTPSSAGSSSVQGTLQQPSLGHSQASPAPAVQTDEARVRAALSDDIGSSASGQQQAASQPAVSGNGRAGDNEHQVAEIQRRIGSSHIATSSEEPQQTQRTPSEAFNGGKAQQDDTETTGSRQQPADICSHRAGERSSTERNDSVVSEQQAAGAEASVSSTDRQFASLVQGTDDLISQIAANQLR